MSDTLPLRVFIVDGDPEMNHHLRRALEGDERWEIVGEAVSVQDVVDDVARLDPDVVLLDRLDNPSREALPRILQVCPRCMVAVVSTDPVPEREAEFKRLGVFACYRKSEVLDGLADRLASDYSEFRRALTGEEVVASWRRKQTETPT